METQLADAMMVSNVHVDEDYVKVGIDYSWKPRIRRIYKYTDIKIHLA